MQEVLDTLNDLLSRFSSIKEKKDILKQQSELEELEKDSQQDGFWNDQHKAQLVMQKIGDLRSEIEKIQEVEKRLQEAKEMLAESTGDVELTAMVSEEVESLKNEVDSLELSTFLSGKFDANNAIVKIYAGQGGTEANDWSDMLFRMYTRYFNSQDWKVTIVEKLDGNEAGIQSVTMLVNGRFAYGYLKHEKGTHRLVRNSPFNSAGLRQTSFANVDVLPQIEDDIDIELNPEEIEFSAVRSSGAGGQSVNKTSSKVRLLHKPTGIAVESSVHKKQSQNRKEAEKLLKARLFEIEEEKREEEMGKLKGVHKKASWGNQIRNYILQPYKLVKDVRTGIETSQVEKILDGELQEFVDAEVRML